MAWISWWYGVCCGAGILYGLLLLGLLVLWWHCHIHIEIHLKERS